MQRAQWVASTIENELITLLLGESFSKFEEKKLTYFNLCEILFKEITKRERDSSQKDAETQNFQARKKRLFASLTDSTQELQAKIADYEENLEQVKKELWSKLEKKFIVRLESEKKELQDRVSKLPHSTLNLAR